MAAAYAKAVLCEILPKYTIPGVKVGKLCNNADFRVLTAERG